MKSILMLKNHIREYDWGSIDFIPELLSMKDPVHNPQAELWMGAHPGGPSQVLIAGEWISLAAYIEQDPKGILGNGVAERFDNKLPFLFKVLAAGKPLSIQAHPNMEQARAGYLRENRLNIPLGAAGRSYRDDNHKPELICALTEFTGLKGFRKIDEIIRVSDMTGSKILKSMTETLRQYPDSGGLRGFFSGILGLMESKKQQLVGQVIQGALKQEKADPCFEWINKLGQAYPGDIGVVAPIFLNLFHLRPGEALFIPAGELHAYLEGAALEIMANSDNVLRGGLTQKHVDVTELLNIVCFEQDPSDVLSPLKGSGNEYFFPCKADEFLLSCIRLVDDRFYEKGPTRNIEILLCLEGQAVIHDDQGNRLDLKKGVSVLVPAGINRYRIHGQATLYKATVP